MECTVDQSFYLCIKASMVFLLGSLNLLLNDLTGCSRWSNPRRKSLLLLRDLLACWGWCIFSFPFFFFFFLLKQYMVIEILYVTLFLVIVSNHYFSFISFLISNDGEMARKLSATSLFTKSSKKNRIRGRAVSMFSEPCFSPE